MANKIYPNDPCPCGSGKKYKNCCGKAKSVHVSDYKRSDRQMEDFIKDRLYEDIDFLNTTLKIILGPKGYDYCLNHSSELDEKFRQGNLWTIAEVDDLGIYEYSKKHPKARNEQLYSGGSPQNQEDIMSLLQKGLISREARQVELFHSYLMYNLNKRFDDYFYLPGEQWVGQFYGPLAHRGYDFLFAMTLYLELQLGVHVYMNYYKESVDEEVVYVKYVKPMVKFFDLLNYTLSDGFIFFLQGYKGVITEISDRYSIHEELQLYYKIKAFNKDEYEYLSSSFSKANPYKGSLNDYILYLKSLVAFICFPHLNSQHATMISFPQCDFAKYYKGLESIHYLFEEKFEGTVSPADGIFSEKLKGQLKDLNYKFGTKNVNRESIYHEVVFYMEDELNGTEYGTKSSNLEYKDFKDITQDEWDEEGYATGNSARKISRPDGEKERKLRLEIYQMLNGRMFNLYDKDQTLDDNYKYEDAVGRYPVLPWLSGGKEKTPHIEPLNGTFLFDRLYSEDVILRQQILQMEIRLTEIPVNCVEEFLIPDIFYTWNGQQKLLEEVKEKNDELMELTDSLKNQIDLNQKLVLNLDHSSANYLNPAKLIETGLELKNADRNHPNVYELHIDGDSLLLQSEQETYMSRQLHSLVWRCAGNLDDLFKQICSGLTTKGGVDVTVPVGFALKTLLNRILFREQDRKSLFIRTKLKKTEEEWLSIKDSFLLDVFGINNKEGKVIIDWWNHNIGELNVIVSDYWSRIQIVPEQAFYDLITEIISEQILNALLYGDLTKMIEITFGQEESKRGRIRWGYILCENAVGDKFKEGSGDGNKLLDRMLLMLNDGERGLDVDNDIFCSKAWIESRYLQPLD